MRARGVLDEAHNPAATVYPRGDPDVLRSKMIEWILRLKWHTCGYQDEEGTPLKRQTEAQWHPSIRLKEE